MQGIKRALKIAFYVTISETLIVVVGIVVLEAIYKLFELFLPLVMALFATIVTFLFLDIFITILLEQSCKKDINDFTESEEK